MLRGITAIVLLLCTLTVTAQNKRPVKVTDLLNIRSLNAVTLNRTGDRAAFVVTAIEPDGENKSDYKYTNQIWMTGTGDQAAPRQLTTKENASQPAWSPDGKQLAFVRAADGKPQIFLLTFDGGEAIQLTKFKYGASQPAWSPDGKQLLFAAGISLQDLLADSILNPNKTLPAWSFEKPGIGNDHLLRTKAKADPDGSLEEVRAYLDNNVTDKKAKVFDKLSFQDETNVSAELSFTHYFIMDAEPGAKPKAVTHGFGRYGNAQFTPDGKQLLLTGDRDSTQHPDRSFENAIYIINTDGSNPRKLLGEKDRNYISPRLSPSGKWLAFQYTNPSFLNSSLVAIPTLAVMPINGSQRDVQILPLDRSKGNLIWSEDEKYLYLAVTSNGGVPVYRIDIKTKKAEQLTSFNEGIGSFDLRNNKLVFVRTAIDNPFELYMADAGAQNAKRISGFNYNWLQGKQLALPEKKTFTNNKGMTVEYWIMKPTNYTAGKKYPLLLEIHGGPAAMWGPGESSMWHEYQYFCSKGYGVVYCNPRGSGGYGKDFLRGNINDWGAGPTSDVLTALDKTIAEGWADTSKLLITGGSYAGYLVAWIIAHDHRFKAACSQRGVYDLATFFGEGNAWRLVPDYFGGYPWQPATKEILERESPITYVQNITTPYIIFHGDNDRRTGFVQSEMLYRSLKILNRPVEYVRHTNATHEITRSGDNRQRIDQMLRTWEFFERWLRP